MTVIVWIAIIFMSLYLLAVMPRIIPRPDFIAYSHKSADNLSRNICCRYGATAVAWTIRSEEELECNRNKFDLFIFEGF